MCVCVCVSCIPKYNRWWVQISLKKWCSRVQILLLQPRLVSLGEQMLELPQSPPAMGSVVLFRSLPTRILLNVRSLNKQITFEVCFEIGCPRIRTENLNGTFDFKMLKVQQEELSSKNSCQVKQHCLPGTIYDFESSTMR
jgi:hypothetical protein